MWQVQKFDNVRLWAVSKLGYYPVADPDLELTAGGGGEGGGAVLIYLPCRPFSRQSFLLFLPKMRGGGPPLDPPLLPLQ